MSEPEPGPHPRDSFDIEGAEAPERAWLEALERGRMHHAWLLVGPEGVGKATFAYRAARRLLGARPDPGRGLLGSDPEDPVCRQLAARAHPDVLVLERESEDGKPRKYIPVDDARRLPEFFSKAPAISPWRVAIIDAADDMNVNASNAVLKTLEEPPARGVLFLVCHSPGRLLATLRSRCRRLLFRPWDDAAVEDFLRRRTELPMEDAHRLAKLAKGAPGKALALANGGALEVDRAASELLRSLPRPDESALLAMAGTLRGQGSQERFELLCNSLSEHVKVMLEDTIGQDGAGPPGPWLDVWDMLTSLPSEAEGINLDRQDAFWTFVAALKHAART
jgi:DNA polymerase-3 subunit delta'